VRAEGVWVENGLAGMPTLELSAGSGDGGVPSGATFVVSLVFVGAVTAAGVGADPV